MIQLKIKVEYLEDLLDALEVIIPLLKDGYNQGINPLWDLDEVEE